MFLKILEKKSLLYSVTVSHSQSHFIRWRVNILILLLYNRTEQNGMSKLPHDVILRVKRVRKKASYIRFWTFYQEQNRYSRPKRLIIIKMIKWSPSNFNNIFKNVIRNFWPATLICVLYSLIMFSYTRESEAFLIWLGWISGHFQYPAGYQILKLSGWSSGNMSSLD